MTTGSPDVPLAPDSEHVVDLCAQLIRIDTSNYGGGKAEGERDAAEFVSELLTDAGLTPTLLESAPGRSNVVVRVPGTEPHRPALLVHGHLDVVPANAADWTVDPFAGEVRDGMVWGRGALDMKGMCSQVLTVVDEWARTGRRPRRDIVIAFVADEEDGGAYGARWLTSTRPDLFAGCTEAIGEFGGFSFHTNGLRLYPVATAERGSAWMKLTASGTSGHASRRNPDNPVTHLVSGLAQLAAHSWPVHLTATAHAFIDRAAAALGVEVDLTDLDGTLARLGRAAVLVESVVRDSATPTMIDAGVKINVVPATATAYVDGRVLPGRHDEFTATTDRLLGPNVRREYVSSAPAVESPIDAPTFAAMSAALNAEDPAAVVVPYCMAGGTDAKAFATLGIAGYGFTPLLLPEGFNYRSMAHGVDERVPVDGLAFGVRVLDRFLATV